MSRIRIAARLRPPLPGPMRIGRSVFEEIFSPGVEAVFDWFSQGCPRLVSLLADRVLLSAYSRQVIPISPDFVEVQAKTMGASRAAGLASDLDLHLDLEQ